ncbi:MAG TPA: hypothetical protein VHM90_00515 [Phycisphaerae bacterium]|nr:hypothetical protein [Phycisphaerae bacterium]
MREKQPINGIGPDGKLHTYDSMKEACEGTGFSPPSIRRSIDEGVDVTSRTSKETWKFTSGAPQAATTPAAKGGKPSDVLKAAAAPDHLQQTIDYLRNQILDLQATVAGLEKIAGAAHG